MEPTNDELVAIIIERAKGLKGLDLKSHPLNTAGKLKRFKEAVDEFERRVKAAATERKKARK